ncbi:hypothetical protein [Pseudomonas sp. PDM31]|uniref:hypothetical protein n=1 Tax=Pseudomonas sp. PDM31 TaxID=2854778 RepID=UPI001C4625DA|nr:hypothetical protein [Pseudomonas sp. PDM31]MBV7476087.1 hypothetical protein [Pseudomonas sp. PDM31]
MPKLNDFKQQIYSCECKFCRAIVWLVKDCRAQLQFAPSRAGRLCELAVVAASGAEGIAESEVVGKRRAYAQHLGIELSGPTSNAETPVHIQWALEHSNHDPKAANPVIIGQARATYSAGRYFLK